MWVGLASFDAPFLVPFGPVKVGVRLVVAVVGFAVVDFSEIEEI